MASLASELRVLFASRRSRPRANLVETGTALNGLPRYAAVAPLSLEVFLTPSAGSYPIQVRKMGHAEPRRERLAQGLSRFQFILSKSRGLTNFNQLHNLQCLEKLSPLLQNDKRALKWLKRECSRGSSTGSAAGVSIEWD